MFLFFRDRTRRLLCRSLFLLLGVLPTGAVLAWSVVLHGDGYRRATCESLSIALGREVRVSRVRPLRPGVLVLEDFELIDPETDKILLRSPRVEIHQSDRAQSIEARQAEIRISGHNWWLPMIERQLHIGQRLPRPLRLSVETINVIWPEGKQTLRRGTMEFNAGEESSSAMATWLWDDDRADEPLQLEMRRVKESGQIVSSFALNTRHGRLPCSLLAAAMELENRCGIAATFQGTLEVTFKPDACDARIVAGTFNQVDLNALVRRHFPGQCSAAATIQIAQAEFHRGRLEAAAGTMKAGAGTADRALVFAVAKALRLTSDLATWPDRVEFAELAADFELSSEGLKISGICDRHPPGVVLRSIGESMLWQPAGTLPPWWRWE
ncbi:MAG: hypothetical protein IT427_17740 [Pirellulales bacterium]|nr:hypothetical protein [Pirellulales bacterium]